MATATKTIADLRCDLETKLAELESEATRVRAAIAALGGAAVPASVAPVQVAPTVPLPPPVVPAFPAWPPPGITIHPASGCTCGVAWGSILPPPTCPVHGLFGGIVITTTDLHPLLPSGTAGCAALPAWTTETWVVGAGGINLAYGAPVYWQG